MQQLGALRNLRNSKRSVSSFLNHLEQHENIRAIPLSLQYKYSVFLPILVPVPISFFVKFQRV